VFQQLLDKKKTERTPIIEVIKKQPKEIMRTASGTEKTRDVRSTLTSSAPGAPDRKDNPEAVHECNQVADRSAVSEQRYAKDGRPSRYRPDDRRPDHKRCRHDADGCTVNRRKSATLFPRSGSPHVSQRPRAPRTSSYVGLRINTLKVVRSVPLDKTHYFGFVLPNIQL
jgi:hypothetical protein